MQKKVVFIINPKAGVKKKMNVPAFIEEHFSKEIEKKIIVWQKIEDLGKIKQEILSGGFNVAVAVGGDGTVNQIAEIINHTDIALGILPFGSGNGLARSIGVSMDIKTALSQVASGHVKKIDSATINDIPFFCTGGTGFDAHIGHLFATNKKRGFSSYVKIIFRELRRYKPKHYKLRLDSKEYEHDAFLITFANAGQYGNDFYIAPNAVMNDGILEVVVVKPFSFFSAIGLVIKAFKRKSHLSKHVITYSAQNISVELPENSYIHVDGEPKPMSGIINVRINRNSLNVIS